MRSRKSNSRCDVSNETIDDSDERKNYSTSTVEYYYGMLFLLFLLFLFYVNFVWNKRLPEPLKLSDEVEFPTKFIAERAQNDLKYLTQLGPRIVGSHENEILTVDYLRRRILEITHDANPQQHIELDVQLTSGSYFLATKPVGRINIYSNIQNVVAKLHGRIANSSLLLNVHFDSVPTSPGGSDDGINCAILLEILRILSKRDTRPEFNIIFLFNGAEETGLQASHGFITQHKWAKESKVVINVEAGGAGGPISMFQTGPNKPWLNNEYSKIPHPRGQAVSEEVFQANLIPSDTDFRIFRDFGKMIGIDMAFHKDGYRYHTKFDGFDNIPLGSYQHAGDNLLSLVDNIANNQYLADDNAPPGRVIFFDVLGAFFISYSTTTGLVLQLAVVIASFLVFYIGLRRFDLGLSMITFFYFCQIVAVVLFGWLLALIVVIFLGFLLDVLGYAMSWYGNPWLIFGIFVLPTIIASTPGLFLIRPQFLSKNANGFVQAQMIRVIWTMMMFGGTIIGIRSTYPLLVVVLLDTLAYTVILCFKLEHSVWQWKIIYLVLSIIPTSFCMTIFLDLLQFIIPLTGRIGSNKPADIIIGFIAVFATLLTLTPYYFLTTLVRQPRKFYLVLVGIFIVALSVVFTPLGFPYSGDPSSPAPQRFWVVHSDRVFHDEIGGVIKKDSGYFFLNMDRNSPNSVKNYVPDLKRAANVEADCENFIMCGMPLAHPKMSEVLKFSTWIPAPIPNVPLPAIDLQVLNKTFIGENVIRYNVTIHAPDHTIFYVSPKHHMKLIRTSFIEGEPEGGLAPISNRLYYNFIFVFGKTMEPLNAMFDITVPTNHTGPTMDLAIVGNYVHPKRLRITPSFKEFLGKFPDWVDMTAWVASYRSWII